MGECVRPVRGARADAEALAALLPLYRSSPEQRSILLDRYYKRSIIELLGESPGPFVLHGSADGDDRQLRVQLSRTPPPRRTATDQAGQQQ